MTPPKKPAPAAEPFRVPALAEVSPEYAGLIQKQADLHTRQAALRGRRKELESTLARMPEPMISSAVAALLGDPAQSKSGVRAELVAILAEARDVDAAIEIIRQRIADARSRASGLVCAAVKGEYGRRVAVISDALQAVAAAREEFQQLVDGLDAEDVQWGALVPMHPNFLGDRVDGPIHRWMRDAREAGYVV